MLCDRRHAWWVTKSRLTTLQTSLIARQWVGLNDSSGIKLSIKLAGPDDLSLIGPTGAQMLDYSCSSVSELVCC